MARDLIFGFTIIYQVLSVLGTLITPQDPRFKPDPQVHCLSNKQPIQIQDPFNPRLKEDPKFIAMEWYQLVPTRGPAQERLLLQFLPNKTNTLVGRFSVFDSWGLQIEDVSLEDSATYKAKLVHLSEGRDWSIDIIVATPPVLESEKLSASRTRSSDGKSVTLSCGRLSSLGSPPVSLVWKAGNGTVLPSDYKDGYIQWRISSEEDASKYTCGLNTSSVATRCILDKDTPRFMEAMTSSSRTESADMTGIIIGAIVGSFAVLILVAIFLFIKIQRRQKAENYNAREQEKRREAELGNANSKLFLKDGVEPNEKAHKPIYKGVVSADPFVISKVSEGSSDLIFQKRDLQMAFPKSMAYLNGDSSHMNGHSLQPYRQERGRVIQAMERDQRRNPHLKIQEPKVEDRKFPDVYPRSVFKHKNSLLVADSANHGMPTNGAVFSQSTMV